MLGEGTLTRRSLGMERSWEGMRGSGSVHRCSEEQIPMK